MPSENVYIWADYAGVLISKVGDRFHIDAPYDDFNDMTLDELESFAQSELKEIREALR